MQSFLEHRGPDDGGIWETSNNYGELAFSHRRLSILDLTEAGHQPMHDVHTGNIIIYNGEVYNFRALRDELTGLGERFRSQSDTEVVLAGFRRWGTNVFAKLEGMYALAIYWKDRQKLILARDGLGIKPLYWGTIAGGVFACSELRGLIKSRAISANLDSAAIGTYLAYGSVSEPISMISGVRMFPPGCFVELDLLSEPHIANPVQFWELPETVIPCARPSATEKLTSLLNESAKTHLESDAPLGIFLSGGIDSSSLAILANRVSNETITTLNVSFPDFEDIDESCVASVTAKGLGVRHIGIQLSESDVVKCIDGFVDCIDQPTLDGLNTYIVSKAAREAGLKVVWSGLGGDELFAGYNTFRQVPSVYRNGKYIRWIPRKWRATMAGLALRPLPDYQRAKAQEMAEDLDDFVGLALRRRRVFSDSEILLSQLQGTKSLTRWKLPSDFCMARACFGDDRIAAMSAIEMSSYMRNTLLRDSDVFGMANSIEIRVPLLHRPLVEYAMSIPGEMRLGRSANSIKELLVESVQSERLNEIARSKKRGFSLPYKQWMQGPFREKLDWGLSVLSKMSILDSKWLNKYWSDRSCPENMPWNRAWALGLLGLWLDKNCNIH